MHKISLPEVDNRYGREIVQATISTTGNRVFFIERFLINKTGSLSFSAVLRQRCFASVVAFVMLASLSGCTNPSPGADAVVPSATETAQYVIGPGDHLGVFVYDNPQLSVADLPVRPDGRISTPLVPDVQASWQTPSQLADVLKERLKKFVRDPNVTIMVHEFIGPFDRQIRVIGEATDPQAIAYSEHMTLLDVMIRTKGLTRFAAGNSALIVRKIPGQGTTQLHVRLSDLIKSGDISQNIQVEPGDTLIIPQTWF